MKNRVNNLTINTESVINKITETTQLASFEFETPYYGIGHSPDKCKGTCITITVKD